MATTSRKPHPVDAEAFLESFAKKLSNTEKLRKGAIVFQLTGDATGEFCLDCSPKNARLVKATPQSAPLIEVIGDASRIRALLEGKKEGRKQFHAGGIRVRGDLPYLSDLAMELGIIDEPL